MPNQPKPTTYIDAFVDFAWKRLFATEESKPILIGPEFDQLFNLAKYANLTREERDMYNASLKRKWDNKNVLDYAVKTAVTTAVAEADQKAREEEKKEVARNFKKIGVSLEDIAKGTGLSIEEIEVL